MRTLEILLLAVLASTGCGPKGPAPGAPAGPTGAAEPGVTATSTPAPKPAPDTGPAATSADCAYGIEATLLESRAPMEWHPPCDSLGLVSSSAGLRLLYTAPPKGALAWAPVGSDGIIGGSRKIEPAIECADGLAVSGDVIGIATTVYRTDRNADVALVTLSAADGTVESSTFVDEDWLLDADPEIAAGPDGRFAVAWGRGPYPSTNDIHFAVVERGKVLSARMVEAGARPEGMALARSRDGYLLIYALTSVARHRRLVALWLDADGEVRERRKLVDGPALWPIAAADGENVAVAFSYGRTVAFLVLGPDGEVLAGPDTVDRLDDPIASFYPETLLAEDGRYWLGDRSSFRASVIIAKPSEARVLTFGRGRSEPASVVLPITKHGSIGLALAHSEGKLVGVYGGVFEGGRAELRTFLPACRTEPPPTALETLLDPCAATSALLSHHALYTGGFGPFSLTGVGENELVFAVDAGWKKRDSRMVVLRTDRAGHALWRTPLSKDPRTPAWHPKLASRGDEIAVVYGTEKATIFVTFDAESGVERARSKLTREARNHCLTALDDEDGYLVAISGDGGARLLRVDAGGKVIETSRVEVRTSEPRSLTGWGHCALTLVGEHPVLIFTYRGDVSETSWLYTQVFEETLLPRGPAVRWADVWFARSPEAVTIGDRVVASWRGPLSRRLFAGAVDVTGRVVAAPREVASSYGYLGHGLRRDDDGERALAIYATEKEYSEHRLCSE